MDSYKLALLLIRVFGVLYIAAGIGWVSAAALISVVQVAIAKPPAGLDTVESSLAVYGLLDLISGPFILLLSKRLARSAAKLGGPSLISN